MATTDDLTLRMRSQGARQASRDVDRTSRSVRGLGKQSGITFRSMTRLGGGLRAIGTGAAAFAIAGGTMAAVLGKQSVDAASDLNEVISKTQVIFKESARGLISWSETTANSLGMSQEQSLAAASGMGNLLVPMGVARKRAGQMSKRMVQLAGDMASFNNASPEETLQALQAAFIGEYDTVQRFGAAITAARVESEAMSQTHKKNKDDLTAAEKAQAAYTLILKDTKDQQGDLGRTSEGLANAERRLAATWENLKAAMGTPLLDIVRRGVNGLIAPLTHVTNVARDVFADKNLNWEQRFRILGASIRHWFGPIADDMIAALKAAHLDRKLNDLIVWASPQISKGFAAVAPAAASAFITGFQNAPVWAQAVTAALLISKLGIGQVGGKGGAAKGAGGGAFGAAGRAAGGTFARAMGPAILVGLAAYANQGDVRKTIESIFNPMAPPSPKVKGAPKKRPPGGTAPKHPGGLSLAPLPDPGSTGGPFGASPGTIIPQLNVHSTLNVDGKPVARSVERASRKKKATR